MLSNITVAQIFFFKKKILTLLRHLTLHAPQNGLLSFSKKKKKKRKKIRLLCTVAEEGEGRWLRCRRCVAALPPCWCYMMCWSVVLCFKRARMMFWAQTYELLTESNTAIIRPFYSSASASAAQGWTENPSAVSPVRPESGLAASWITFTAAVAGRAVVLEEPTTAEEGEEERRQAPLPFPRRWPQRALAWLILLTWKLYKTMAIGQSNFDLLIVAENRVQK